MALRVELVEVVKRFGPATVLDSVGLTIEPGSIVGVLGNSGSGKTTLLRIIAGLEDCTAGAVYLSRGDTRKPAAKPTIGMVFQNLALWPHLTARQHLECVVSSCTREERRRRVDALLAEVALPADSWGRRPGQLSGGEGQRLAVARALAGEPELLLLDEPLAHLDAVLRGELLDLLARVSRQRGATTFYVTHQWAEAVELCQQIVVLDRGRIAQQGTPDELYWSPVDRSVARLTGPCLEVPIAWLADGSVQGESPATGLNDGADAVWIRPQQLHIERVVDGGWRVASCRPQESGWSCVTIGPHERCLRVATAHALPVGQRVALGIVSAERAVRCGAPSDVIENIVQTGDGL